MRLDDSALGRALLRVAPWLAALMIRALRRSIRFDFVGRERLERLRSDDQPFILAFWHGRLMMMPYAYPGGDITILISQHRDGELIARTMQRFGFHVSRGSSTRRGAAGLRHLVKSLRRGYDAAVTPDGPRGPREVAQMGVVQAARLSGCPIVPVAFGAERGRFHSSWDRFLVPRLFTRGRFVYGEPLTVPRRCDEAEMERMRARLEAEMARVTAAADDWG